jgi:hypothetical protein
LNKSWINVGRQIDKRHLKNGNDKMRLEAKFLNERAPSGQYKNIDILIRPLEKLSVKVQN